MSKIKSRIKLVTNEIAWQLWMARHDHAIVTGQEFVERPHWYEDMETGRLFHDIYACLGWPSEVKEGDLGLPGYAAIIGVCRPHDRDEHYNPINSKFLMLEEFEDQDVPTLLDKCIEMRKRWGYGLRSDLLTIWYGDPDRFLSVLARKNEFLTKLGGPDNALLLTPPEDFYTPQIFDQYARAMQSALLRRGGEKGSQRFFFGGNVILKARLEAFRRDDPAVLAMGGLVHSLLSRTLWMDERGETVFNVGDA